MKGEIYSRVAGIPTVTAFRTATPKLTANAEREGNAVKLIPVTLPRLKFTHGDVEEVLEVRAPNVAPQPKEAPQQPTLAQRRVLGKPLSEREEKAIALTKTGLPPKEVGERMGITASRARTIIANARAKLRIKPE